MRRGYGADADSDGVAECESPRSCQQLEIRSQWVMDRLVGDRMVKIPMRHSSGGAVHLWYDSDTMCTKVAR